jgi:chaperonin GroES|tara:strand:+ start:48 stop:332 length:285 start_codon:yes stop_codon:yes gene_type:complete
MIELKPLSDFIFLEVVKEKESKGGIILPNVSKSKPAKARVLAVGPGRLDRHGNLVKTMLKVGDTIILDPFTPREVKVDDKDYFVIRESDVFAKL